MRFTVHEVKRFSVHEVMRLHTRCPDLPYHQSVLANQRDDVIQIRRSNPQIYHRGRIFKVPTHLIGEHQLILTSDAYTLYSTIDGEQSLSFPLPVRLASSARLVPLWQVHGARIRDPKPAWTQKRIEYADIYFAAEQTA